VSSSPVVRDRFCLTILHMQVVSSSSALVQTHRARLRMEASLWQSIRHSSRCGIGQRQRYHSRQPFRLFCRRCSHRLGRTPCQVRVKGAYFRSTDLQLKLKTETLHSSGFPVFTLKMQQVGPLRAIQESTLCDAVSMGLGEE